MNTTGDMNDFGTTIAKGITGTLTPMLAIGISVQSAIASLQIISLSVGIAVGLATLHSILKKKK